MMTSIRCRSGNEECFAKANHPVRFGHSRFGTYEWNVPEQTHQSLPIRTLHQAMVFNCSRIG